MNLLRSLGFGGGLLLLATGAFAANKNVTYKNGKDIDFESLLIEGQLKRPEISIVTGDTEQGTNGLLRLRENFLDKITSDNGEDLMEAR